MQYEELLKRGIKAMPKKSESTSRFVIPKANASRSGAKTIINNFFELADDLRRDPYHLLKFLLKELATKGDIENKRLIVLGNFSPEVIDKKIEIYVKAYVTCSECGKPDTKLIKERGFSFLICEACGARHSLGK